MKPLFAALIVTGLALAPAAFAEDGVKPAKATKVKIDRKTDATSQSSKARKPSPPAARSDYIPEVGVDHTRM